MSKQPSRLYQYLATSAALLCMITDGMHYAWTSPSLPRLTSNSSSSFQITDDEGSLIAIMPLISAIPSCLLGAYIMDIIGRKISILLVAIPHFIAWLIIIFANSALTLCLARFLAGISSGIAFTVIPVYIGEIADPQIRGMLGAGISVNWIFGMLLINVIGLHMSIQMTASVSLAFPLLALVTFVWMPESPYFLLAKNDHERARKALKKFKGKRDLERDLSALQEVVSSQKQGTILDLLKTRSNQRALGILAIARNSQQMGGTAAISFYTLSILSETGDFMSPSTATITYASIQCLMTVVCSAIVDKAGRRPLLIVSLIGSALSLIVLGTYFYLKDFTNIDVSFLNFMPVVALISYVIIFNLGAQPIPLLMQCELFPTNVKALASCLSEMYFYALAAVVSKFFQMMRDQVGMYLPFHVFSLLCVINLVFVILFVTETKNKTLEEIQEELQKRSYSL